MSASNVQSRLESQLVRVPTNSVDHRLLSLNERILNEVFDMYKQKDVGLCALAKLLDVQVRVPQKKVTVLIIGNHSAGKSSFINWYIEETVLKAGVALETQGYFLVVSGKRRDSLKGKATLELYPHLRPLKNYAGCLDNLTTEVSTSRAKKFNLVTFIDTPGLVDGDMEYPFDVNETLLWLGGIADLILVFFEPMGQALCKRTLNLVEKLWANQSDKMRLFLAKADEAGSETDRQRVLMQIVQELCKRPGLNRTGFEMPTIYIPDATSRATKCTNQIQDVCDTIEKTVEQSVQNSLNDLDKDALLFKRELETRLSQDDGARSRNFHRCVQRVIFGGLGLFLTLLIILNWILATVTSETWRAFIVPSGAADAFDTIMQPLEDFWIMISQESSLLILRTTAVLTGILIILQRLLSPYEKIMSKNELTRMRSGLRFVDNAIERKKTMYADYLRQSLHDSDIFE